MSRSLAEEYYSSLFHLVIVPFLEVLDSGTNLTDDWPSRARGANCLEPVPMSTTPLSRTYEVQLSSRDQEIGDFQTAKVPKRPQPTAANSSLNGDPLLTAEDVAQRLRVSTDWVWDHSSRKKPFLPVIRMGDGTLRYRTSGIEAFIDERERLSSFHRRPR